MRENLHKGLLVRLSKRMKNVIVDAVHVSFGDVKIYLFGSRVDDKKKGGDIDVALKINVPKDDFRKQKVAFMQYLMQKGYDLKIDLLQWNETIDTLLDNEIKNNHLLLEK